MLTTIRVANIPTGATTTIVARIYRLTKGTMCLRQSDTVSGERCACGCEVALEAAQRSLVGLALGLFAREVLLGGGVVLGAGDRDRVQRPVELAIPAAIEAVLGSLPGGAWDRSGA